jgi:arabinofuranan 3-O-arabinosyltransferase
VVGGSPSSLLSLLAAGVLQNHAAILAGDPDGGAAAAATTNATWADTDGNQRRDLGFGSVRNSDSYVLGPDQRSSIAQRNVPQNLAVVTGQQHQTVAAPLGAESVAASTFSSTPLAVDSAQGPSAAFDHDLSTAWVGNDKSDSVGQWVQIDFGRSIDLHDITVQPLADGSQRPKVTGIEISTARGSVLRTIRTGNDRISVPSGRSTWLRVTLTKVRPARAKSLTGFPLGAGLTSVNIPGVDYVPALRVPNDETSSFEHGSNRLVYSFSAPMTNAELSLGEISDDDPLMVRQFSVPQSTNLTMFGQATPAPGTALSALLPRVTSSVQVTSSSLLGNLPRFAASNLITGSAQPWIAGQGDAKPSVTFSWSGDRTVSSIVLKPTSQAARPREVIISSPAGRVTESVPKKGGTINFTPMATDSLTVRFVKVNRQIGRVPASGTRIVLPVGVKKLSIPALGSVTATTPANGAFDLPCGQGPTIRLDGSLLSTKVIGTVGELENMRPMGLLVCGGPVSVAQGSHVLEAGRLNGAFTVTSLQALPGARPSASGARTARTVGPWTSDHREVHVSAGAATYLTVAQNYNEGWKATLDGRALPPVRVDGWQQAWLVPAGASGTVVMTLAADSWYRMALLVGALLLAVLIVFALVRRGRHDHPPAPQRRRTFRVLLGILGFAVLLLVSGPIALVFLPLVYAARRWGRTALALVGAVAFVAAGIAAAVSPGASPETGLGAFGWPAQVFAAVALAALLASLVVVDKDGALATPVDLHPFETGI